MGNVKGTLEKSAEPSGLFRTAGDNFFVDQVYYLEEILARIEEDMPVADPTLFHLKYLGMLSCC